MLTKSLEGQADSVSSLIIGTFGGIMAFLLGPLTPSTLIIIHNAAQAVLGPE